MNQEKIIVYILISLVMIGGVMFGMSTVNKIQKKQNTAIITKFLIDFDKQIKITKDNYGKVVVESFRLSKETEKICVIDLKSHNNNLSEIEDYPLIKESITMLVDKNLFLISGINMEGYFNPYIRLNGNKTLCIEDPNQEFSLKFTGTANSTMIEKI